MSGGQDLEQDLGASERWRHTGVECNSWATAPGAWAGLSQPEEAEEEEEEEEGGALSSWTDFRFSHLIVMVMNCMQFQSCHTFHKLADH